MGKLKSLDELKKIREKISSGVELRTTGENPDRIIVRIGMATCGIAAGAREIMTTIIDELELKEIKNVSVVATGCLGFCSAEPLVEVDIPNHPPIRYGNVDKRIAIKIVDEHIGKGILIDNAIFNGGGIRE